MPTISKRSNNFWSQVSNLDRNPSTVFVASDHLTCHRQWDFPTSQPTTFVQKQSAILNFLATWAAIFPMLVFPTELYNAWAQQKNRKSADLEIAVLCLLLVLARAAISYCIISDLYEIILSLPLFLVFHVDYKFKLKVCVEDSFCDHLSTEQHCIYVCTVASSLRTTYAATALVVNDCKGLLEMCHGFRFR